MIVRSAQADAFVREPDNKIRAILFYGPNAGLIAERAEAVLRAIGVDPGDPFAVVELSVAALTSDPARLADEAAALPFTGGERVVRVCGATDAVGAIVGAWLHQTPVAGRAIIEAGELTKGSALRKAVESAGNGAAVACYVDDGQALIRLVREVLAEGAKGISEDAAEALARHLSPDRAQARRELEKLVLYVGAAPRIELADVVACIDDNGAASLDAAVFAACDGDARILDREMERLFAGGAQPVMVIRAAARHLQRLLQAAELVEQGRSAEQAMSALRPPVFVMVRQRFQRHLRLWPSGRLAPALHVLLQAELDCKTTGLPGNAVCHRALMRLAQAASTG
ncbi:MAG: DNA polymerase III subunit delta [Rhodospirillales bacterium]|nr:DNA polymerase III subunit delta [Rhodospirillales bacterium]